MPDSNGRDEAWEWEGETITMVKEVASPPDEEGDEVNSVRSGGIIQCFMVDNLSMFAGDSFCCSGQLIGKILNDTVTLLSVMVSCVEIVTGRTLRHSAPPAGRRNVRQQRLQHIWKEERHS